MTTVAVIGSNCFTGSHIVDALLTGTEHRVIGISRSPEYKPLYLPYRQAGRPLDRFRFHQIDFVTGFPALLQLLDEERPSVVINVAALSEVGLSNQQPVEYFETNTTALVKLVNQLRQRSFLQRFVHISSAEIFGSCTEPVTEEALFNPSTPYAVSKAAADMYLNVMARSFGFPVTIIRSTNVYGVHQQLFKIIPRTAIYLKSKRVIELHGGGQSLKSFVHISDVVRGLLLALEQGASGTFHLTAPSDQRVADIVRLVCEQAGHDFEAATRTVGERLGQDAAYRLDTTRARQELGWQPQVELGDGVQQVIEWIDRSWQEIRHEPLEYMHRYAGTRS